MLAARQLVGKRPVVEKRVRPPQRVRQPGTIEHLGPTASGELPTARDALRARIALSGSPLESAA